MKQFTISLYSDLQRPVMPLTSWHNFNAMLDTGAIFPVWVDNESLLKKAGAILSKKNVPISGIGGRTTGNLYRIPFFKIGELIFPDMSIVASPLKMPCHLLLSATMFTGLRYEIDNENHKLNVEIPDTESSVRNLVIKDENGRLHVLCQSGRLPQ